MRRPLAVLTTLLLLAACGKPAEKPAAQAQAETPGLTLKAEDIKGLGITTVPAMAASWPPAGHRLWRGDGAGCHRPE